MGNLLNYNQVQKVFSGASKLIKLIGYSIRNAAKDYGTAKVPLEKGWNSDIVSPLTEESADEWINQSGWIGCIVPAGMILVDVDDRIQGEMMMNILQIEQNKYHAIQTPNGWQFLFKDSGCVQTQNTKVITNVGFLVDYRLQGKGYFVLPTEGTPNREWEHVCDSELDYMPDWLNPLSIKSKVESSFNIPILEGSRNDVAYRHACRLQAKGLSDDEIKRHCLFLGRYFCEPPMNEQEANRTIESALCYEKGKKNSPIKGATATTSIPHESINDWGKPDREGLEENTLPIFDVNVFPKVLSNFICGDAESTQTPIDASCMAAIASLSTVLSKKVIIHAYGKYKEPVNTFGVVALPPGNRKSAVFQLFQEPIYLYEAMAREKVAPLVAEQSALIDSEKKKLEKLKTDYSKGKQVSEEIRILARDIMEMEGKQLFLPRFITDDITQEKLVGLMAENGEKMANLSAEGGLFDIIAGRYSKGKPNLEIFLKGHAGDACTVDRMGRSESMLSPALTLGLFIQPMVLKDMPAELAGRGLMARFLYCIPHSIVGDRKIRPEPLNDGIQAAYNQIIHKLMEFEPNESIILRPTEAASEYLRTIEESFEPRLSTNGDLFSIVEWASKQIGQALRIVALLHIAEHIHLLPNIPMEISESTMRKGLSLIEYFIPHARKAFDCMEANEAIEDTRYLWRKLKSLGSDPQFQQGSFTKQEVWKATKGKFKKAERLDSALESLTERNYIKVVKDINGEAGRNSVLILLNPMTKMTKTMNEPILTSEISNSSNYSHQIQQIKNENYKLQEHKSLQSNEELESEDIYL
jgi:replicative DNA helicase